MRVLQEIVRKKQQDVRNRKRRATMSLLTGHIKEMPPARGFGAALRKGDAVAIIAEIKQASPSRGVIRTDFDPADLSATYDRAGATALSVLTDAPFFQGSFDHLRLARKETRLPILQKDFILEPYQVAEARVQGADAVLLILRVLAERQLRELAAAATEFGLDVLVESHTGAELDRALSEGFSVVGINNRNLDDFTVDLKTSERLAERVPANVTLVSESGIRARSDVERLGRCGVDAALVGESLLRQRNVGPALEQLIGVTRCQR